MAADSQTVTHITQNGRYRIVIERAASTKGVDGFKVEANGDIMGEVQSEIEQLYAHAITVTSPKMVTVEG